MKLRALIICFTLLITACNQQASADREISGVSIRKDQKEQMVQALQKGNIYFQVFEHAQGGHVLKWDPKDTKAAMKIINQVMTDNKW